MYMYIYKMFKIKKGERMKGRECHTEGNTGSCQTNIKHWAYNKEKEKERESERKRKTAMT